MDLNKVYEFRPPAGYFGDDCLRYNNGDWISDDGEYDLCFIGYGGSGAPMVYMVELPYQKNIIYSWLTTHWSHNVPAHPNGNPWHYALRDGSPDWGGDWGRDNHPNTRAGREGMNKLCSMRRCANGIHVEWKEADKVILAGLLRTVDTKEIVRFPDGMTCTYCGIAPEFPDALPDPHKEKK